MEAYYLTSAESVFPLGDFYILDGAADITQNSNLSNCHKKWLQEMLAMIQRERMVSQRRSTASSREAKT